MEIDFTSHGIAEQRKVCDAATPGPWEVQRLGRYEDHDECQIDLPDDDIELAKYENADFIAMARTAYPAALTEIERMQGLLAERDENIERLDALVEGLRCCETYYNDYRADNAALRAQVDSLTRERDAALADGEKAKQYWLQANDERDAAINDLTTAMVDMYIEGRGDETHICWACAHAKQYKDRYPCSSCINYEMAEFVHRGVCADNTHAPDGAESEGSVE